MKLQVIDVVGSLPLLVPFLSPFALATNEPGSATAAIARARNWLAEHQDLDGKWDADEFWKHDPEGERSTGAGQPEHDVGVTALALLAFLATGNTTDAGEHRETVERGLAWLRAQQDPDSGRIGEDRGHAYMYRHGIAALALCEAHVLGGHAEHAPVTQKAVDYVLRARNPYAAWRYDCPPVGDNDTSVTGWMIAALESARQGELAVDPRACTEAIDWIDSVTDPATGRVGYSARGSTSSRVPGVNEDYPTDRTEGMTASGLLSRFLVGQDPGRVEVMGRHADLLLKALPEWRRDGRTNDLYYWFHGTFAMYRMGGRHWAAWQEALREAVLAMQRNEGSEAGSWDPDGPWGYAGGRVYSTALGVMCLATYERHTFLYGSRGRD